MHWTLRQTDQKNPIYTEGLFLSSQYCKGGWWGRVQMKNTIRWQDALCGLKHMYDLLIRKSQFNYVYRKPDMGERMNPYSGQKKFLCLISSGSWFPFPKWSLGVTILFCNFPLFTRLRIRRPAGSKSHFQCSFFPLCSFPSSCPLLLT